MLTSKRNKCCIFYCLLSVFLLFSFIEKGFKLFFYLYTSLLYLLNYLYSLCFAVTLSPYFLSCCLSHVANELKHAFSSVCLQHCLLHFYKSPSPALRNPTLTKLPFLISWKKKIEGISTAAVPPEGAPLSLTVTGSHTSKSLLDLFFMLIRFAWYIFPGLSTLPSLSQLILLPSYTGLLLYQHTASLACLLLCHYPYS